MSSRSSRLLFSLLVTKTSLARRSRTRGRPGRPRARCRTSARCRCAGSRSRAPSVVALTVSSGLIWKTPKPELRDLDAVVQGDRGHAMPQGVPSIGEAPRDAGRAACRREPLPGRGRSTPALPPCGTADRDADRRSSGAPASASSAASAGGQRRDGERGLRAPGVDGRAGERRAGGDAERQPGDRPGQRLGERRARHPRLHQRRAGHEHRRDGQAGEERRSRSSTGSEPTAQQQLRRRAPKSDRACRRTGRPACRAAGRGRRPARRRGCPPA